jgi:hypothetical protein
MVIEDICLSFRKGGYLYAKNYYKDWSLYDEDLKYIDECGHPLKDEFSERVYENAYHLYTSGTNDEAFMEFSIDEFTPEQRDLVRNIDLFEVAISEGIDDFINEIYEE